MLPMVKFYEASTALHMGLYLKLTLCPPFMLYRTHGMHACVIVWMALG